MASKYVKKTHHEHILDRPDTYIGSCEPVTETQWVFDAAQDRMIERDVTFVPGLYKIFDEVLNNAIDQTFLDPTLDAIVIRVTDQEVMVQNTGSGIPIELHPEYGVYVPELIFGHLLTSSNYDDTQARTTGGRNGYGAKLANIFSTMFSIEVVNLKQGLIYKQTFEKNMTMVAPPTIKVAGKSVRKGSVTLTFKPDLERFGMKTLEGDILALMQRRALDCAACTPANVSVSFNGQKVPIKTFEKYIDKFLGGGPKAFPRAFQSFGDRWDIGIARCPSDLGFRHVSFVNGIATPKGGTHMAYIANQVVEKMRQGHKRGSEVKPYDLKERLIVFVRCTLVNPTFTGQTKEELASKVSNFGSRCDLSDDFVKKLLRLGIVDEALEKSNNRALAKNDGTKRVTVTVPKLEDANKAGTQESWKCTLILTEGDSAKTFAISGLSEVNRNYWGVFPLKGKMLNVRDASARQISENQEITYLKQILGLQHGKDYQDVKNLRYGRVMLLTDADQDGHHIKGLVMNMFHAFWPSLLSKGFLCTMNTPVVKAFRGQKTERAFYTIPEYRQWKEDPATDLKGIRIKYYKGLGTSTSQEAKEYFKGIDKNTVTFVPDDQCNDSMELAFRKTLAQRRKEWVSGICPEDSSIDAQRSQSVDVSAFIHKDLVSFSMEDVIRSIPSVVDGLKPSQRKVMYACLKRNLRQEIRVSQLAGYVSEVTSYHHGETSLCGTITSMAQAFAGSNNMNPLAPIGQFGSRLAGGKDASSPRYIFTRLEPWVYDVFDSRDDALLEYLDDDGTPIEPKHYYCTLPMVLINGTEGIGTGFSTSVPCYDPKVIIENIRRYLSGVPLLDMHPWYRGFKGVIEAREGHPGTYDVHGVFRETGPGTLEITELPVGTWTNDYKDFLESEKAQAFVKSFENHSTEKDVLFRVKLQPGLPAPPDLKTLNLSKVIHLGNMHLFDPHGRIHKYASPEEILREFCAVRLAKYSDRKDALVSDLQKQVHELDVRTRFIGEVVEGSLVVFKRKISDVLADMESHGYPVDASPKLLDIPITHFTTDKIQELCQRREKARATLAQLLETRPDDLWLQDLAKI